MTDEHEAIIRARYQAYTRAYDDRLSSERWSFRDGHWFQDGRLATWRPMSRKHAVAEHAMRSHEAEVAAKRATEALALSELLRALHDAGMGNAAPEGK